MLFSIDQGGGEILVLLDLSSAFDTLDHAVLFDLWHDTFGISGPALSLLKSYLHDRTQCVQIDGIISELLNWFVEFRRVLFWDHGIFVCTCAQKVPYYAIMVLTTTFI